MKIDNGVRDEETVAGARAGTDPGHVQMGPTSLGLAHGAVITASRGLNQHRGQTEAGAGAINRTCLDSLLSLRCWL